MALEGAVGIVDAHDATERVVGPHLRERVLHEGVGRLVVERGREVGLVLLDGQALGAEHSAAGADEPRVGCGVDDDGAASAVGDDGRAGSACVLVMATRPSPSV